MMKMTARFFQVAQNLGLFTKIGTLVYPISFLLKESPVIYPYISYAVKEGKSVLIQINLCLYNHKVKELIK